MAESPLSPSAHSSTNTTINENSTGSTARMLVPVDLQCPVTPQLNLKLSEASSSSSSESDNDAVLAVNLSGARGNDSSARTTSSPPPNCAICLGRCKNKCFTDSCMHQFCFKCLCEWSKVKPECPLCKQIFKSIIHNVKSIDQFEEYHVLTPPSLPVDPNMVRAIERNLRLPYLMTNNSSRRWDGIDVSLANPSQGSLINIAATNFFPSSSSATGSSSASAAVISPMLLSHANVQNQFVHRGELLEMYRQEYPDGIPSGGSFNGTLSHLWRRYVYDRKLYALPVCDVTGRFRQCTARFYRDNPAQIHRLMPWINRDIICLLRNTEHDATSILERIKQWLSFTDILKPFFRRRLQPILGARTAHFIHELHNFARSPYDMIGYDRAVQYSPRNTEEVVVEFSLSSSSSGELHSTEDEEPLNIDGDVEGASNEGAGGGGGGGTAASAARHTRRGRQPRSQTSTSRAAVREYTPLMNLLSFSISTTSEGAEVPGVSTATSVVSALRSGSQSAAINLTTHNRSNDVIELDDTDVDIGTITSTLAGAASMLERQPGAPASSTVASAAAPLATPIITENIELSSTTSSDECEFVLERKPPHLRTPEMVSLNSESDSDVVFVAEGRSQERKSEQKRPEKPAAFPIAENSGKEMKEELQATEAKAATVSTQEHYNVGASTSAGLRSSGRQRRQTAIDMERNKLKRVERRKRSVRNNNREHFYESSSTSSDSEGASGNGERVHYSTRKRSSEATRAARRTIRRSARIKKRRYNMQEENECSPGGTKEFETDDAAAAAATSSSFRFAKSFKYQTYFEGSTTEGMSEVSTEIAQRRRQTFLAVDVDGNEVGPAQVGAFSNAINEEEEAGEGVDGGGEEEEEAMEEKYDITNLHVMSVNGEEQSNLTANNVTTNTNSIYNELTLAMAMTDDASPSSRPQEFQQLSPPNQEQEEEEEAADVKSHRSEGRASLRSSLSSNYTSVTSTCSESSTTSELSSSSSSSSVNSNSSASEEESDNDNVVRKDRRNGRNGRDGGLVAKRLPPEREEEEGEQQAAGNMATIHRDMQTDTLDAAEMLTSMRHMDDVQQQQQPQHSEAIAEAATYNAEFAAGDIEEADHADL